MLLSDRLESACVYLHVFVLVCVCVHVFVFVCTRVYACVWVCVCMVYDIISLRRQRERSCRATCG